MDQIIKHILPQDFVKYIDSSNEEAVEEIRLKVERPGIILYRKDKNNRQEYVTDYCLSKEEMENVLNRLTGYSVYAYENQIKEGFITIRGGSRVGLAGKIVLEDGKIKTISNISSINIRVSRDIPDCAGHIMEKITEKDEETGNIKTLNTLIFSSPGKGKTTLLRDILRRLSDDFNKKVGLVDERGEVAACYEGVPQRCVGIRTDVYDNCPKALGMMLLIRGMSPDTVGVDEIGDMEDAKAIYSINYCGCSVVATLHAGSVRDMEYKPEIKQMMERQIFKRYIFIDNGMYYVYDNNFNRI